MFILIKCALKQIAISIYLHKKLLFFSILYVKEKATRLEHFSNFFNKLDSFIILTLNVLLTKLKQNC